MDQNILRQLFAQEQAAQQSLPPEQVGAQQPMARAPAQAQPMAPQGQPTQGGMDPQQAMQQIHGMLQQMPQQQAAPSQPVSPAEPNRGVKLLSTKDGGLGVRVPVDQPLLALFGMKKTQKIDPTNYFDTLSTRLGPDAAKALLPSNTPVTPEGKPFLSAHVYDRISAGVGKAASEEKPNMSIGKLALAKLEKTYGKNSPVYQNAKEYMDTNGGLPPKQFSEFINSSMKEETPNFVKGANGLYQHFDRASESWKTVPGQTVGVLEALNDPASAKMFDTKLQDFRTDPVAKQLQTTLDALSNSSNLLESNNPAALGSFFGNIARSVGLEKGPLNEGDIQRAVGDSAYGSTLYRWLSKRGLTVEDFGKGKFSDGDLKDFRGLLKDMGTSTNKRYETLLGRHVSSAVKTIPGLTEEYVRNAFDTGNRFMPGEERRLKGEATNYPSEKPTAGATASGTKWKIIP